MNQEEIEIFFGENFAVKPVFVEEGWDIIYYPDERIIKIDSRLIEPRKESFLWAYRREATVQSAVSLFIDSTLSGGFDLTGPNKSVVNKIEEAYNSLGDYGTNTFEEFIANSIEGLAIFGNHLAYPIFEDNSLVAINSIPWTTVDVVVEPHMGWVKYVQRVPSYKKKDKREFYTTVEDYVKIGGRDEVYIEADSESEFKRVLLHPNRVLHFRLSNFRNPVIGRSPLEAVLTTIVYKKLIEYGLFATLERFWSPLFVYSWEEPPQTEEERARQKEILRKLLSKSKHIQRHSAVGLPYGLSLDIKQPFEPSKVVDFLEYLKRDILLGYCVSVNLIEARGVELASSRTLITIFNRVVKYYQMKIAHTLQRRLHPKIAKGGEKVEITWRELSIEDKKNLAKALRDLIESGIITTEEARIEWGLPEEPLRGSMSFLDKLKKKKG